MKQLLYGDPRAAHRLLEVVTRVTERYVAAQVRAGAQAIQLFDSWAGLLAPEEYREFDLRYARRVLERLRAEAVPRIYFALDAAHLLEEVRECGADVVGLDWRVPLDEASARLGHGFVLQGNLDPTVLLAPREALERRTIAVLEQGRAAPGHVFNLGHGVLPETPLRSLEALVETVQRQPVGRPR
jgi:uroporphyrinogen decarboxylase